MNAALYGALDVLDSLFKLISKDLGLSKAPSDYSGSWLAPLKLAGALSLIGTMWVVVRWGSYGSPVEHAQ